MRAMGKAVIAILVCGAMIGCSNMPLRDNAFDAPIPADAFRVALSSQHYPAGTFPQDSFFVRIGLNIADARLDSAGIVGPRGTVIPLAGRDAEWSARLPAAMLSDPRLVHTENYGLEIVGWDSRGHDYVLGPLRVHYVFRTIPVMTAPVEGSRESLRPKFSWERLPEDSTVEFHYVIVYSRLVAAGHLDETQEDVAAVQIPADSTSYQPGDELTEGTYAWKLCAVDAHGDSVCSPLVQFEVEASF